MQARRVWGDAQFQSTQPKRAATNDEITRRREAEISIHAAQEGCDKFVPLHRIFISSFQSTQPKRAATWGTINFNASRSNISIHAAQEGCDAVC